MTDLNEAQVLSYAKVRELFHWKSNRTIRDHVKLGLLCRVRVNRSSNGFFITASSVKLLQEHRAALTDESSYAQKAHLQTIRERKGLPPDKHEEVLLDAQEIIRNAHIHLGGALPDPSPEQENIYEAPSRRTAPVTFSQRRGI